MYGVYKVIGRKYSIKSFVGMCVCVCGNIKNVTCPQVALFSERGMGWLRLWTTGKRERGERTGAGSEFDRGERIARESGGSCQALLETADSRPWLIRRDFVWRVIVMLRVGGRCAAVLAKRENIGGDFRSVDCKHGGTLLYLHLYTYNHRTNIRRAYAIKYLKTLKKHAYTYWHKNCC